MRAFFLFPTADAKAEHPALVREIHRCWANTFEKAEGTSPLKLSFSGYFNLEGS